MTFQKLNHLQGGHNFLLKSRDKPEKERVDVEMGGLPLFYNFTVQLNHIYRVCVWEGGKGGGVRFPLYLSNLQSFELAMQDSHQSFKIFIHVLIQVFY